MKWEKVEFNEVLEKIIGGGTPSKTVSDYWNGDIPWCSVKDMVDDKYQLYSTKDTITNSGLENSSSNLIPSETVITSTRMGLGRAFINKVDMAINQDLKALIPNEKIDNKFLLWTIVNKKEEIEGLGIGSTVKGIRLEVLRGLKINLPPLPTQRKIASILSAYDDLIENNLKRIKLLEEKAQLHYKELMQEMGYSKTKREEYIKDCLAFYIGGGWGEEDYKEGFTEPAFVIRGTDIPDAKKGEVKGVPFRYHKESNLASRNMQAGDIVFEVSGGSKGQPVGRSILITEKMLQQFGKPVMCASFCKMLRPNENVTPEFFYLYLLASHENGVIAQYEKHSASNIVNYGFEEFISEQKITIPKETELKAFTEKVKPIFTLINTLGEQNSKLREARDILLPKLMNGQIEV